MSLSSISVRRPVTTLMFYAGLVMLGAIAFNNLSIDFLPPVSIPKLTVRTTYPNVSPDEIEHSVTQPIEASLGTVAGAKRVFSVTREGLSIVTAEFSWGTNMDFTMLDVREKLDQLRATLPGDAGRPIILRIDPSVEPIMSIAVSGNGSDNAAHNDTGGVPGTGSSSIGRNEVRDLVELKETVRALVKRRIEQVDGVAQAAVIGGLEREIRVDVDTRKMQEFGFTLDQVAQSLGSANLNLPGGTIKRGGFRYSLRTSGEFTRLDDIRHVVVSQQVSSARPVRVSDIGTVRDAFKERLGITRYNGNEIIALHIRKEAGSNTVEVSRKVHSALAQLRRENVGLHFAILSDQAEFIRRSVEDVEQAIAIGACLSFLVLFAFLRNPKYPLIIGLTIPVSILTTFIAMYFLHINLNIISLTGLALGIGMLGDNAIVLIENITCLREVGESLLNATLLGAKTIATVLTASTLTNVAIFLPIVFVEGVAAQLFLDMGVTMTVSLLVSLLVSVTLVPMLMSGKAQRRREAFTGWAASPAVAEAQHAQTGILISPVRGLVTLIAAFVVNVASRIWGLLIGMSSRIYGGIDRMNEWLYPALDRYLVWALDHRLLVIAATSFFLLASIGFSLLIPGEPTPDIDQSRFTVSVHMPKGTSLDGVSRFIAMLEFKLGSLPEVEGVYANIGITEENNYWAVTDGSMDRAELEVKVREVGQTRRTIEQTREILASLRKSVSGVEFAVKPRGTTFEHLLRPDANDVNVLIAGADPNLLSQIAAQYADRLKHVHGLADVRLSLQEGTPEYQISVDRREASRYGLTVRGVAQHIADQVRGKEATSLSDFDRKVAIRVQPEADLRKGMDDILLSSILAGDRRIPVRDLVHWEQRGGSAEIWREHQQRVLIISANVTGGAIGPVVDDLERQAASISLAAGYSISIGGENEEIQESFNSLVIVILLAVFLVYMILAAEYESVLYPLVILLTSPLAFVGAIFAMIITGQNYNVMSLVGIVIMIGAVDNDAVIVVDIITELRRKGMSLPDAIRHGMKQRLRPILMTTSTTVLGVVPLLFDSGTGSQLVRALTAPIVGGLIASTIFTVATIPVVYAWIDPWTMKKNVMLESDNPLTGTRVDNM